MSTCGFDLCTDGFGTWHSDVFSLICSQSSGTFGEVEGLSTLWRSAGRGYVGDFLVSSDVVCLYRDTENANVQVKNLHFRLGSCYDVTPNP